MKHYIFKAAALIAAAMMLFVLAACTPSVGPSGTATPTDAPTEAPTDPDPNAPTEEQFIDAAWPFAERMAELYGFLFSKETVRCTVSENVQGDHNGFMWIPDSREDGATLRLQMTCSADTGEFAPTSMNFESTHSDEWWASLDGYEFYGRVLTVTPEDLIACGCTAEPGTPEFNDALNLCWGEKLAEEMKNAPDGDPLKCTEVLVSIDRNHVDDDDAVCLTMKPVEPDKLFAIMEYSTFICGGSWLDHEYFGWYSAEFRTSFTENADGSWSSPIYDYDAEESSVPDLNP